MADSIDSEGDTGEHRILSFKEAALEIERKRMVKDVDDMLNDGISQICEFCPDIRGLAFTAGAEGRLRKLVRNLRITIIAKTPNTVFTIKDILNYETGGDNYGSRYDQVRTWLNTLFDAGIIDRDVGINGEYIFSSKGTDPAAVKARLEREEKIAQDFLNLIVKNSETGEDGKSKIVRCILPAGKGKICGAQCTSRNQSETVIITRCKAGHTVCIDFENHTRKKINQRKPRTRGGDN